MNNKIPISQGQIIALKGECSGYYLKVENVSVLAIWGTKFHVLENGENVVTGHEVWKRKFVHRFDFKNKCSLPETFETMPKSNSFGKWAWYFMNKEKALQKFNEISDNV